MPTLASGLVGAVPKFIPQMLHGFAVYLADAALGFANRPGNTQHSPVLKVVKYQDICFIDWNLRNNHAKFVSRLVLVADGVGTLLWVICHGRHL